MGLYEKKRIDIVILVVAITSLIAVGIVVFLQGFVLKPNHVRADFTSSDPPDVESLNLTAPEEIVLLKLILLSYMIQLVKIGKT